MGERIARGHLLDYVVTSVPIMTSGTTVAAALELPRRQRFESTEHVLIADTAGRFVGAVALTDIFSASPEAPIGDLTAANVATGERRSGSRGCGEHSGSQRNSGTGGLRP
jgi:CBS domain-containing protein